MSDVVTGAPGGGLGTVYIAYGPATGKMNAADAVAISSLGRNANFGDDIDGGDANGDAASDLLVTTYALETSKRKGAYLFLGPITADRSTSDADAFVSTDSVYETTGLIVPDATGDGDADLVVGRSAESPRSFDGGVFVLPGPVTGDVSAATGAAYVYEPDTTNSSFGVAVMDLGDTNGDGVTDLLASAPYIAAPAAGTMYLIAGGGTPGTYSVADAAYATLTSTPGANYGEITAVGDVDGDGNVDIVASGDGIVDGAGNAADGAYLHLGPFTGATSTEDATARWLSDVADTQYVGRSLASGADLDGDEVDDIVIGAFDATDQTWSGVFLQLGTPSGTIEIETLPSIMGTWPDNTGCLVSFVPDWDGDGRAEVAVAADTFEPGDPSRSVGAIFVVRSSELD